LEAWKLLAHNHWFTLNIFGYKVRLCARCSGYLLGFATLFFVFNFLSESIRLKSLDLQWPIFFLLGIPLVLDWVTQSWGLRTSNNHVRLITGSLMGMNVFLFSKYSIDPQMGKVFFVGAALTVILLGLLGSFKRTAHSWNLN
jgi:uncharacterized membrane protein